MEISGPYERNAQLRFFIERVLRGLEKVFRPSKLYARATGRVFYYLRAFAERIANLACGIDRKHEHFCPAGGRPRERFRKVFCKPPRAGISMGLKIDDCFGA